MATDRTHDWYAGSDRMLVYCRDAAARLAPLERRPQLIHHHRYSVDCAGQVHERLGTVEQLQLEGYELGPGVSGGTV